jgi:hypothetical protein
LTLTRVTLQARAARPTRAARPVLHLIRVALLTHPLRLVMGLTHPVLIRMQRSSSGVTCPMLPTQAQGVVLIQTPLPASDMIRLVLPVQTLRLVMGLRVTLI